jgi:hypothetical protein
LRILTRYCSVAGQAMVMRLISRVSMRRANTLASSSRLIKAHMLPAQDHVVVDRGHDPSTPADE